MRLTLIRHGETEHNRGRLTLGRADVALNERGRAQAAALAGAFAVAPDAVYCSPLARARDTAAAIAGPWGIEVIVDEGLVEMDVGEMEHLTREELRARYPEFLAQWLSASAADGRMPGGETLREVQERAWGAVERLRARHPRGDVVAVTHNFVILTLLCRALNLPLAEFRRLRQMLAARTVFEVGESSCTLLQLNDVSYLAAAGLADDLRGREARA